MKHLFFYSILAASAGFAQKFYLDDPLQHEPPPVHVKTALSRKLSDYYDLLKHQFSPPGEKQSQKASPIKAQGVNTLGEPMEGTWWVKRHYYRRMTREELMRGPDNGAPPSMDGPWTILSAKNEGVTPGFQIQDSKGNRYFVKFDSFSNPEMATAADSITSRFFYALGYHVPANYVVYFHPDQLELNQGLEIADSTGRNRPMTKRDVMEILINVPRMQDGRYRATASFSLPGKTIGPPRWFGTRLDDPNDIVPHEHRRDLRGLHVIDAWLGHDDSRAINNIDVLVQENGVQYIRHYQLDFGSTLGSATIRPNSARSGAYFFEWTESAKLLFSFGLYVPYWARAQYPDLPSVGRLEWKTFDPDRWVPEYHNPAFMNRLPDDEFWGAKLVKAFSDDDIRAIVSTGEYSDPKATEWVIECLIQRREKIGRTYFARVLPLDQFRIHQGALAWDDLSQIHGYGGSGNLQIQWSNFNNQTEQETLIEGAQSTIVPSITEGNYAVAKLTQISKPTNTISVYVRRQNQELEVVGVDRTW